ncbi:DUF1643 domain-containing protein [Maridesulfovibrio frigidus]|uniref:DUF1643 domain-containing protein n=1 Tax=Maridesulfovibrio frigidus TaxID=340956 RepID=UPI0004E27884
MKKTAIISECGYYRYELRREWDNLLPTVLFICLNPSTADNETDDPTSRVCINYAKRWGYGSLTIANLFAYRSTNPDILSTVNDPVGPKNDAHLKRLIKESDEVICAWSNDGGLYKRDQDVLPLVSNPKCLVKLKSGKPGHPLYKSRNLAPVPL